MRSLILAITRDLVSMVGAAIVTFSVAIVLTLFLLELVGFDSGPYVGILAYLVLPTFLAIGLVLIPIGIRRARLKSARTGEEPRLPVIDLNVDRTRNIVLGVLALSVVNVIIFALATYKGVEVMESNEFCGAACHSVMAPEYTAYVRAPHAHVDCVECHIGSGADWFAKSKLAGAWQVVSVTFDLYPRPIPTPVHGMRPASETCGDCHWSSRYVGDRLTVIDRHASDEENTPLKTVLNMRIGGRIGNHSSGIHWHADPDVQIRYRSDRSRSTIYDVEMRLADGTSKTFLNPAQSEPGWEEEAGDLEWRTMDCTDCHNRPTHIYGLPESEVDGALQSGELASLPYVRREAIAALEATYGSHEEARSVIPPRLTDFYRENYPDLMAARGDEVAAAGALVAELYSRNVFPSMNIGWGTYPDHSGHEAFPGCYRCHDDEHETAEGETISQDCDSCHTVVAWDEEEPEILDLLEF